MTRGRTLLMSLSGFSTKFFGKEKPVIHYPIFIQQEKTKATLAGTNNSYVLNTLRRLCISKSFNQCHPWQRCQKCLLVFLNVITRIVSPRQRHQKYRGGMS
jgi:hypothetical protein